MTSGSEFEEEQTNGRFVAVRPWVTGIIKLVFGGKSTYALPMAMIADRQMWVEKMGGGVLVDGERYCWLDEEDRDLTGLSDDQLYRAATALRKAGLIKTDYKKKATKGGQIHTSARYRVVDERVSGLIREWRAAKAAGRNSAESPAGGTDNSAESPAGGPPDNSAESSAGNSAESSVNNSAESSVAPNTPTTRRAPTTEPLFGDTPKTAVAEKGPEELAEWVFDTAAGPPPVLRAWVATVAGALLKAGVNTQDTYDTLIALGEDWTPENVEAALVELGIKHRKLKLTATLANGGKTKRFCVADPTAGNGFRDRLWDLAVELRGDPSEMSDNQRGAWKRQLEDVRHDSVLAGDEDKALDELRRRAARWVGGWPVQPSCPLKVVLNAWGDLAVDKPRRAGGGRQSNYDRAQEIIRRRQEELDKQGDVA